MKLLQHKAAALFVLAGLLNLSGCVPLMLGGAMTGTMVATDRRTSATVLEDNTIELKAGSRISENVGDRAHVNVNSYNRKLLLTGEVPTLQDKQLVEKLVADVDNVSSVVNELAVIGNSTLTQRSSDLLVGTRIKARLVDTHDLVTNAFKVVTERGNVYVMGKVTAKEAKRATEVIRSVDGVQRLVLLWDIISEEELARMLPAPSSADTGAK